MNGREYDVDFHELVEGCTLIQKIIYDLRALKEKVEELKALVEEMRLLPGGDLYEQAKTRFESHQ